MKKESSLTLGVSYHAVPCRAAVLRPRLRRPFPLHLFGHIPMILYLTTQPRPSPRFFVPGTPSFALSTSVLLYTVPFYHSGALRYVFRVGWFVGKTCTSVMLGSLVAAKGGPSEALIQSVHLFIF